MITEESVLVVATPVVTLLVVTLLVVLVVTQGPKLLVLELVELCTMSAPTALRISTRTVFAVCGTSVVGRHAAYWNVVLFG